MEKNGLFEIFVAFPIDIEGSAQYEEKGMRVHE